jgi:hypothetical protein
LLDRAEELGRTTRGLRSRRSYGRTHNAQAAGLTQPTGWLKHFLKLPKLTRSFRTSRCRRGFGVEFLCDESFCRASIRTRSPQARCTMGSVESRCCNLSNRGLCADHHRCRGAADPGGSRSHRDSANDSTTNSSTPAQLSAVQLRCYRRRLPWRSAQGLIRLLTHQQPV